jgi:Homeodomain-like domain
VAAQVQLPVRTVRRLFARFARRGAAGIPPDYRSCGSRQPARADPDLVRQVCQLRRAHPTWGAELIRVVLREGAPAAPLPSARTLRRHLRQAGLQPAPAGRPARADRPRLPRADQPHLGWQTDAAEGLRLRSGQRVCWLRVVDECSGAFLQTVVFPHARWEQVDRQAIQEGFRRIFARWGRPARLRVDNGYPWGSTGEFPPELALWLLGLDIDLCWIPPGCPQHNGVVERSQGVGQNWVEPQTCADVATLQGRCDAMDRRQRERYPYAAGKSRWEAYPGLRHSGRPYHRRWEEQHWSLPRVLGVLADQVVARQVDRQGCVSLYHRTRYVGKPHAGKRVYVYLDSSGPSWVVADAAGQQLRTLPAEELTAERIRGLTVGGRKGRDKRG